MEIALGALVDDLRKNLGSKRASLLILLDLSLAFDTIHQNIIWEYLTELDWVGHC